MTTAGDHVDISRRFIQQAEEELEAGDLLQASEKAWGAVAHRLKAIARQRGWQHGSHGHFYAIVERLGAETGQPEEMEALFARANSLHANFYNVFMPEEQVRGYMDDVMRLLATLEGIGLD